MYIVYQILKMSVWACPYTDLQNVYFVYLLLISCIFHDNIYTYKPEGRTNKLYQELKTWCVQHGVKTYLHRCTQKQKLKFGCNKYLHMNLSQNTNLNVFYDDNTRCFIIDAYILKKGKSQFNFICEYDYVPYITSFIELLKYCEV